MKGYEFIDNKGTFKLEDPDLYSYLYFPVGAASGMMGSLTPEFGGDLKTSQNTFILEPVSSDNLHNNRSTRNFWICLEDGTLVSATGASASSHAKRFTSGKDKATLYGGLLWQKVERVISGTDLKTEVTTFVPVETSDRSSSRGVRSPTPDLQKLLSRPLRQHPFTDVPQTTSGTTETLLLCSTE